MTALGIEMTDREAPATWADIKPVIRRTNPIRDYSIQAYELADEMLEKGFPWDEINAMSEVAKNLGIMADNGAECSCTPRYDCDLCKLVARVVYHD